MHSDLLLLSELEKSEDNLEKSSFYEFIAEQIVMANTSHCKRIHPENSFTMALALQLKSKSSYHYEILRKNIPFLMLPRKRAFSEYNKTSAISADSIFKTEVSSPHCILLRHICRVMC